MIARVSRVILVLWAGSLWALALWVAPLLFKLAPDRHAAGVIAAGLFQAESYLTLGVALIALWRYGRDRCRGLYLAAALLMLNELIIKRIFDLVRVSGKILGLGFGAWHGLAGALYVVACLAALLVVWKDDFR